MSELRSTPNSNIGTQNALGHVCMHGSSLGSNPLFIFGPILTVAGVSFGLCGIFDIWIVQQILKFK